VFVEFITNPAAVTLAQQVKLDCVVYAYRVMSITQTREEAMSKKISKKKDLAKSADVEMADATQPGPSMQSLIDKAVSARLKTLKASSSGSSRGQATVSCHTPSSTLQRANLLPSGFEGEGQVIRDKSRYLQRTGRISAKVYSKTGTSSPIGITRWQGEDSSQTGRSRRQNRQEEGGEGEGEVSCTVANLTTVQNNLYNIVVPNEWYIDSRLIPDCLLKVPYDAAIKILILNTPVNILQANAYKNLIHRGPNVTLPREIELDLSVGFRYMFHTPRNAKLIKAAWLDFEERLRWRVYFSFDKTPETEDSYDPDYEVPHVRKGKPPRLPRYIEQGILLGRNFVHKAISNIPKEEVGRKYNPLVPDRSRIEEFLIEHDYVCTMTDKNLGIAVSERTWLDERCISLLSDTDNYTPIHDLIVNEICNTQCILMEQIATLAGNIPDFPESQQLPQFFRHLITEEGKKHMVPKFYGIPKIHKEPVKVRPIIPCHSAIQNPAAKYVSKKLKPLVKAAPSILKGTKDLALKLSEIKIDHTRKWWIVTGDVVAFYPNIPLEHCINIICSMYEEYTGVPSTEKELKEMQLFILALRVGNLNLITQYNNLFYRQKNGLAMGVSDSPDLANLYGWWFERNAQIMSHPLIPYYGRFIDDILAIVYASSEAEARGILNLIKFDGCVIEWNVSESSAPFLDMTLYRDSDNSLQHMPYRKARSHQERVPWISHHPLDVKRGTYIGEMSRLATLCSKHSHYIDAIRGLCALYIARGYPKNLVINWTRMNISSRWENRLSKQQRVQTHESLMVLKSSFNTAWNYFNAKELGNTVVDYWRGWLAAAESDTFGARYPIFSDDVGEVTDTPEALCVSVRTMAGPALLPDIRAIGLDKSRWLVSRKRTRNLLDLSSLWKKTVFEKLEMDVSDPTVEPASDHEMNNISSDESETDMGYLFSTIGYR